MNTKNQTNIVFEEIYEEKQLLEVLAKREAIAYCHAEGHDLYYILVSRSVS
jgi:hypothetical protein